MPSRSGGFENQDPAVIERDFGGFPCGALIEPVWVGFRWFPRKGWQGRRDGEARRGFSPALDTAFFDGGRGFSGQGKDAPPLRALELSPAPSSGSAP